MGPRYPFRLIKQAFRNLYFLMFLNGFLLASLFYFKMESTYENGLFASLKSSIDGQIDNDDTPDSVAVKAMSTCYYLMVPRATAFRGDLGLEASFFHSTAIDLMTTRGACGSYSQVLARTLASYHYPVRIAQMKAQGIYGAHNIVEAQIGPRWVVLDPTYNLYFIRPDARLASFADVKKDWTYYSKQVPVGYNLAYHYEDVRYTNWTKIPILSPALKAVFSLVIGPERTDSFSMRTFFMNTYAVYLYVLLALYIPLFLVTLRSLLKTKVFPSPEIPVTFGNIIKYLRPRSQGTYTH
jgi:hypothetical protein